MKYILSMLDKFQMRFLKKHINIMPENFVKMIAYYHPNPYLRKDYYEKLGVKMGKNTLANLGLTVTRSKKRPCVVIGDNVSIAPNVTFICDSDANNGKKLNKLKYVKEKLHKTAIITVGDEVWIGANVTIFPGVKIGKFSVIGAGSLVAKDTEPYGIYAGAPAKKIRDVRTGKKVSKRRKKA